MTKQEFIDRYKTNPDSYPYNMIAYMEEKNVQMVKDLNKLIKDAQREAWETSEKADILIVKGEAFKMSFEDWYKQQSDELDVVVCNCKKGSVHSINRICQKCKGVVPIKQQSDG